MALLLRIAGPRRLRSPLPRQICRRIAGAVLLAGLALAAAPAHAGKILEEGEKRYSQHDEELIIRDFFEDRRGGTFLDVGCAWPKHNSTTYYLEKHLGWSGIGVDALARYAEGWKEHRPRSRFLNYLVTDHSGTLDSFYEARWSGVSSKHEKIVSDRDLPYKEVKVPSITLTKLLEENGVEELDLLSIDIEGAQMEALRGFEIERFRPALVVIEVYEPDRDAILQYFTDHGYARIERYLEHDAVNWYFAPKSEKSPQE